MKGFIWESSVYRTRTPNIDPKHQNTSSKSSRKKNALMSKSKDSPYNDFPRPYCFLFSKSRLSTRQGREETDLPVNEEIKNSEQSVKILEKPSLEQYNNDSPQKSPVIIHTYARKRFFVALKEKNNKKVQLDSKKFFISPIVRLGIAGWKLSKPRCATPNFLPLREKSPPLLQIITKKIE